MRTILINVFGQQSIDTFILHCIAKSVPRFTCYNLDKHDPIGIIFGRSEKARNRTLLCFPTSPVLPCASALPCERGYPADSALVLCACNTVQQRSRLRF